MRVCNGCGATKPYEEFSRKTTTASGRLIRQARCKTCVSAAEREYRRLHGPEVRAKERAHYWKNQDKKRAIRRASMARHMERICKERTEAYRTDPRVRARHRLYAAIKSGKVQRETVCSWCGDGNRTVEAHHEDYDKPLEVTWLCRSCHGRTRHKDMVA